VDVRLLDPGESLTIEPHDRGGQPDA